MATWITQYVYNNADDVIVGKVLGATQLGFYSQAFRLSRLPDSGISSVLNLVLLPAYSQISEDKSRLRRAYLNVLRLTSVVVVPVAMGIFVLAPEAVLILIGAKWADAVPVLQIFALMSLIRPLSGTTSPLFHSLNSPEFNLRTALVQAGVLGILIWPCIQWGINGVAGAVVVAFFLGYVHNIYLVCYKTGLSIRVSEILEQIRPSMIAGLIMVGVLAGTKMAANVWGGGVDSVGELIALSLAGVAIYSLSLFLVDRRLFQEAWVTFVSAVKKKRKAGGRNVRPPND